MDPSTLQQPLQNTDDDVPAPKTTGVRDPAATILSMYMTRVQKFEDENVENWKGGAEGILVFVRFSSALTTTIVVYLQALSLLLSRLASSPPRWLLSSPSAIRTCSKIPTLPPSSSSHKYLNNFRTPPQVTPVALQVHLSKVPSSLPRRWYLSTQSGSSVSCSVSRVRSWPHFCNNGPADTSR